MIFQSRNLDNPDEIRKFTNGELGVVTLSGAIVGRAVFQPGWRWSNDVKPVAGTESCEVGNEPCVALDWSAAADYAKSAE
jgi:hypothetical protein